jgi:hypothetical protein
MDLHEGAELAPEVRPPAVLRAATAQVWTKRLIFIDKVVQPHRIVRRGDDRRNCRLMLGAEAREKQILEISKGDTTVDCTSGREGDDQGICPAR